MHRSRLTSSFVPVFSLALPCAISSILVAGCIDLEPREDAGADTGDSSLAGKITVFGISGQATQADDAAQKMATRRLVASLFTQTEQNSTTGATAQASQDQATSQIHPQRRSHAPEIQTDTIEWRASEAMVFLGKNPLARSELKKRLHDVVVQNRWSFTADIASCAGTHLCLLSLHKDGKLLDLQETTQAVNLLAKAKIDGIHAVSRNVYRHGLRIPDDPNFGFQWHYALANLPAAWDITIGNPDLVVAVVDGGLVLSHPDMLGRTVTGFDMITDPGLSGDGNGRDSDPSDPGDGALPNGQSSFHGTHVAGTIGARTDNGEGVAGVTWQGRILPVRVLGTGLRGADFDILSGVLWAVGERGIDGAPNNANPAKVVNLSLGGASDAQAQEVWRETINLLVNEIPEEYGNPIFVAAAGNDDADASSITPANIPDIITVGATRLNGRRANYSNRGSAVDIMAPGGQDTEDLNVDGLPDGVLSTVGNDYNIEQGTSMAAPHVSGIAALVAGLQPDITQREMQDLLKSTANNSFQCPEGCGAGLIDAVQALLAAGGTVETEPHLAVSPESLFFSTGLTRSDVEVFNLGSETLDFTARIEGAQGDLFSISDASGTVPPGTSTLITVRLDRDDFTAGSANLIFEGAGAAAGQEARVDLQFDDENNTPIRSLDAVLVGAFKDPGNGNLQQVGDQIITTLDDDFRYAISNLPEGSYYIVAIGDDNDDGNFDAQRESFGAYPNNASPQPIFVDGTQSVERLDFTISSGFSLAAEGSVGSRCNSNADCTFAPDAECITDFEGGYCSRLCDDGFCGANASCETLNCGEADCNICLSVCVSDTQCRTDDDYRCDDFGTCTPIGFQ